MTSNKLNRARVADLHRAMTGHAERGDIPGIVTLIGILLTQRLMDSPEPPPVFSDFWTYTYRSLDL